MNPLPGVPDRLVGAGDAAHQARDGTHDKLLVYQVPVSQTHLFMELIMS